MHSSDEDIELCSADRFDSIEPNFLHEKHKDNQQIRKSLGTVRRDVNRLSSARFEKLFKFDSFTSIIFLIKKYNISKKIVRFLSTL